MHRPTRLVLVLGVVLPAILLAAWATEAQEPVTSRFKLSIGGYLKPEFMYRTNNGGIASAGGVPGLQNFGFAAVPQKNTTAGTNGQFEGAAVESRFNFTINAPDWRGLKLLGFLEMDFEGDSPSAIARQGAIAPMTGIGNAFETIKNGGFRIRHSFMRLSGEGMGGSWVLLFGQTWNVYGMGPYFFGSSVSFGGGPVGLFAGRPVQLRLQHTWNILRDLAWENTVSARQDTNFSGLNEIPGGDASTRFSYSGWQGFRGGARAPLTFGFAATVQRQKADVTAPVAGAVGSATQSGRSLSNTAWGIYGAAYLPILPGRSATDRTWALSALGEGGYVEGVNTLIVGGNPLGPGTIGAPNRADPGGSFFHPGKCSLNFGPPPTAAIGLAPSAGNPCPTIGGITGVPTELSLVKASHASWNAQFFLPYGFWLSGGQKYIWYSNADNANAPTCVTSSTGACLGVAGNQAGPAGTIASGRDALTATGAPAAGFNNTTALFAGRDSALKRQTYSMVAVFYDMSPNIRWGFEVGRHATNRKDSAQDNDSWRYQFAAYYFF